MESARPTSPCQTGLCRLNLLLSAAGTIPWRDESWAETLPRLLEPMGVRSYRVRSGLEAAALIRQVPVHIALVDLALPLDDGAGGDPAVLQPAEEGGPRLLQLLGRLETPPPTVVVKRGKTHREDVRTICNALRAGAFAVLERPVNIETALEVMRRILTRYHAGRWPAITNPQQN